MGSFRKMLEIAHRTSKSYLVIIGLQFTLAKKINEAKLRVHSDMDQIIHLFSEVIRLYLNNVGLDSLKIDKKIVIWSSLTLLPLFLSYFTIIYWVCILLIKTQFVCLLLFQTEIYVQ